LFIACKTTNSYALGIDPREAPMSNVTTLSSKFQISIPKDVRDAQKWKAGQQVAFIPRGTSMVLVPVPTIEALRGIARGADPEGYRDRDDRS
jgi:AbrB family looped-hinge helix DNA binding protein